MRWSISGVNHRSGREVEVSDPHPEVHNRLVTIVWRPIKKQQPAAASGTGNEELVHSKAPTNYYFFTVTNSGFAEYVAFITKLIEMFAITEISCFSAVSAFGAAFSVM